MQRALHDRVPRVGDREFVAVVHLGLDVVVDAPRSRPGRASTSSVGERPRRVLDPRRFGRDAGAERLEELELALEDPLVGAEDLVFVLLQRRRDEALAAGNRLLAEVVGRHACRFDFEISM